ncbi:FANCE protein, partial [Amia calva]|nr:FANCE protein [Amia calva]
MDPAELLARFGCRSRLLLQSLMSGPCGARRALRVFQRQHGSDPGHPTHGWMDTLARDEPSLGGKGLAVKPLVCLFPVPFQRNLLSFLHLAHTVLPGPSLLRLLQCLGRDPSPDPWVQALLGLLQRDLQPGDQPSSPILTSQCRDRLARLCGRLGVGGPAGTGAGWLGRQAQTDASLVKMDAQDPENPRKRKSESAGLSQASNGAGSQSKKQRLAGSTDAQEDCGSAGGISSNEGVSSAVGGEAQLPHTGESSPAAAAGEPGQVLQSPGPEDVNVPCSREALPEHIRAESSSPPVLQVLNECDPAEVEQLCEALCLPEVPEQALPPFCTSLLEVSPDLSYSTAATLVRSLFLSKILSLLEAASRFLVTAVTSFCRRYPRPSCCALIGPVLQVEQAGSAQMELLCRLVEDCLEPQYRLLVFGQTLAVPWSEGVLSVIHALLDTKMELSEEMFDQFTVRLSQQAPLFSKSMKFAKMLLAILTKYQSHITVAHKNTLSCCLALNETFLKKSLQVALKRV